MDETVLWKIMPSLDDDNDGLAAHNAHLAELSKLRVANQDNFDKSIITLASFGLGLSLSFLKDFLPIERAEVSCMLYGSWALFTIAIFSVLLSFFVSNVVLAQHAEMYEKCFDDKQAIFDGKVRSQKWLTLLNYSSALSFFFALTATALFVGLNLSIASKYKEGFCKDVTGIYVACKLPPKSPQSTNGERVNTEQGLRNSVVITFVDTKAKAGMEPALNEEAPATSTNQTLQNTVTLTLPYVSGTVAPTTIHRKKKEPCKPCETPKNEAVRPDAEHNDVQR